MLLVYLSVLTRPIVRCACVPDVPDQLLSDPTVLKHPSVVEAFEKVERELSGFFVNTTRDGLSFVVVCSSILKPGRAKYMRTSC